MKHKRVLPTLVLLLALGALTAVYAQRRGTGWWLSLSQADRPFISYKFPPAPIFKPGAYDVFISVGDKTGTPTIALPLAHDDGHRRYRLGKIAVR